MKTYILFFGSLVYAQTKIVDSITDEVLSFLGFAGVSHLTPDDIRQANATYTYKLNKSKDASNKIAMLTSLASTLCLTLFGFDPTDPLYQSTLNTAIDICTFADVTNSTPNIEANKDLLAQILIKNKICIDLLNTSEVNRLPSFVRSKLLSASAQLTSLSKLASIYLDGGTTRTTPLFILLTGPPDVGKSDAIKFLQKALLYQETGRDNAEDHVFHYTGNKYWDGYVNNKFVVMDDMFKTQDMEQRSQEASDIIGMVNTVPYPLNVAFTNKGHVFFNSPYIFATTNLANEGIRNTTLQLNMTDNDAVLRRMHFVIHKTTPWTNDHERMIFTVHKCNIVGFEDQVNKQLNLIELGRLIYAMKQAQRDAHARFLVPLSYLQEKFGVVEPQSKPLLNPMTYIRFFMTNFSTLSQTSLFASIAVSLFCVLVALCKYSSLLSFFFPSEDVPIQPNSFEGLKRKAARSARTPHRNAGTSRHRPAYSSNVDYNSLSLNFSSSLPNISKGIINMIGSGLEDSGEWYSEQAIGVHLRDRFVLVPTHFFYKFRKHQKRVLSLFTAYGTFEVEMPVDHISIDNSDLTIFRLPPKLPTFPSMLTYFPTEDTVFDIVPGAHLQLARMEEDGSPKYTDCIMSKHSHPRTYNAGEDLTVHVEFPFTYEADCHHGDSGSPIFLDRRGRALIMGLHVGAFSDSNGTPHGLAISIFQEDINYLIGELDPLFAPIFPHSVLYKVPIEKSHYPPMNSKLTRTEMYGWTGKPCTRIPAQLKPKLIDGVSHNPLFAAMSKNHQVFTEETYIPPSVIDYLFRMYPKQGSIPLTIEESLNGPDHPLGININMTTSPGYPYTLANTQGKSKYVHRDKDDRLYVTPEFSAIVSKYDNDLRSGVQIPVLWADTLKDELRPFHKAHKPRLFQTCPLHFLVLGRRYLLPFAIAAQERCVESPISVGINMTSLQAGQLVERITSPGGSIIAGDFSNYDGLLPAFVGKVALEFLNLWFEDSPEDKVARSLLFEHIYSATHICYDDVYRVCDGNPSGNPFTSLYNSLCNVIMCYTVLTQDIHLQPNEFQIAVYGDDNLIGTVKPDLRCSNLTPHFKRRFGMSYTHFSKQDVDPLDSILTVGYLGRSFVRMGSIWKCPLPLERIEEICMWYQGTQDTNVVMISMIVSMFLEFSQFSRMEFETYTSELLKALTQKRPELVSVVKSQVMSYTEYDLRYFEVASEGLSGIVPTSKRIQYYCSNFAEPKSASAISDTRNEEMSSKAVNELSTTQEVQLGSYMDAAAVTVTSTNDAVYQEAHMDNNMELFDLNKVLDREYLLGNYSWSTASAAGTVIATFNFPRVLFAQTFISNKIQDYSYFRGGIRFSVRVAANSFIYGRLLVNYVPRPNWNQFQAQSTNIYTGSGYPHILVSASASEVGVLDVPFISPNRCIATDTGEDSEMGRFQIIILNPLTDIQGNVGVANIAVTAQFLDAEVWMPKDVVVPTSRRIEAYKKSASGTLSSKFESRATGAAKVAITKSRSVLPSFVEGALSAAGTAAEIGAILGLDKPTSVAAIQPVRVLNTSDFACGRGMSNATKFAMDPENGISTKPIVGGADVDEMDLNYIAGMPMLVTSVGMVAATGPTRMFTVGPTDTNLCYVDFLTRQFALYSGGYKFKTYITASTMHSIKLVFWVNNSAVLTAWQDCYHQIVDVQGDTEVEFTIPYIASTFSRTLGDTDTYSVWMRTLSWSQPVPSVSAPIYVNIYKAGDSDMQFGAHLERQFRVQSNPRADFAKAFKPFHESFAAYKTEGLLYGETYRSLRDILHKQHPYYQVNSADRPIWDKNFVPTTTALYGLEMWGLIFQYWRGSIRITCIKNNNILGGIFGRMITENMPGLDMCYGVKPLMEAEFPFYSCRAYWPTTVAPDIPLNFAAVTGTGYTYLCKSAGDDFSFHFLTPPPYGLVENVSVAANGYSGLRAFLAASA